MIRKRDFGLSLLLVGTTFLVNKVYQESSISVIGSPTRQAVMKIYDSLPIFRLKENVLSYYNATDQVRLNLFPKRSHDRIASAIMLNYQTQIKYKYFPYIYYPSGNYELTLFPINTDIHETTQISGTFEQSGNHAVHYELDKKPVYRTSQSPKIIADKIGEKRFKDSTKGKAFGIDLESVNGKNVAYRLDSSIDSHTSSDNWSSGKVFINTTPRDANIELLSQPGVLFKNGMRFDTPHLKVKVSAPNHIYTIRTLKLSRGKNIFVLPLQQIRR